MTEKKNRIIIEEKKTEVRPKDKEFEEMLAKSNNSGEKLEKEEGPAKSEPKPIAEKIISDIKQTSKQEPKQKIIDYRKR